MSLKSHGIGLGVQIVRMGHSGCTTFKRRIQLTRAGTCQDQRIPRSYPQILSGKPGTLLRKTGQYPSPLSLDHLRNEERRDTSGGVRGPRT